MTEDEMVGWHHRLDGHEMEQAPGDSEGQGSLPCYCSWGHKELDQQCDLPWRIFHMLLKRMCTLLLSDRI